MASVPFTFLLDVRWKIAYKAVGYNHLISNKHNWNNCFIQNAPIIELVFV